MMGEVAVLPHQAIVNFNDEQIQLIKNTVAKGATNDELQMFLYLAKEYGLDPFKKEIWFMKYSSKDPIIMTSRDGYLKYAQNDPNFLGLISFPVKEGDTFEIDAANYTVVHKFGAKRGKLIGAWARLDMNGKKPFIAYVDFDEYNQNNQVWNKYSSAMIQKVAEVFVMKRGLNISGMVTKEEMTMEEAENESCFTHAETVNEKKEQPVKRISNNNCSKAQQGLITKLFGDLGYPDNIQEAWLADNFNGKEHKEDLTKTEASEAIKKLQEEQKNKKADQTEPTEPAAAEAEHEDQFFADDLPF